MRKWLRRIRGAIGMGFTFRALRRGGRSAAILLSALFVRGASLGWGEVLAISTTFALASAACASGSLAVARRAVRRELPDIGGDTAEAELADHEKRKLL